MTIFLRKQQVEEFVRERMPDVDDTAAVALIADCVWREGHSMGLTSGHDWQWLIDTMPADMEDYRELLLPDPPTTDEQRQAWADP